MARHSFRTSLLLTITGAVVLLQFGCSKWSQHVESQRATKRIAQIDDQLAHWVPTGRPGDADARAALRAERAQLAKQLGLTTPDSALAQVEKSPTPAPTPVPDPAAVASKIVIAPAASNSVAPTDPRTLRQLNLTSSGGRVDPRTGAIEPNATPWREPEKP